MGIIQWMMISKPVSSFQMCQCVNFIDNECMYDQQNENIKNCTKYPIT